VQQEVRSTGKIFIAMSFQLFSIFHIAVASDPSVCHFQVFRLSGY